MKVYNELAARGLIVQVTNEAAADGGQPSYRYDRRHCHDR